MNRGGAVAATPGKTPLKDGGIPVELGKATKSGRKVKRPAHFDDSPDSKRAGSGLDDASPKQKNVPEAVKKSARKTILKGGDDSPRSNGDSEAEASKKSARRTLLNQDSRDKEQDQAPKTASRRTMTVNNKEDSPEPETVKKSARKTVRSKEDSVELEGVKKSARKTVSNKEDSPEPETVKKSARKTVFNKEDSPEPETVKKSARITVSNMEDSPEPERVKKTARKTVSNKEDSPEPETVNKSTRKTVSNKEDSPEPETVKKSARKTLLKSAVKNASLEQSTPKKGKSDTDSPKTSAAMKTEVPVEETPAGPGVSRTGRKIKVPAHLKEFEDVVVATIQKETPEKSVSRKSVAPFAKQLEMEDKPAPKTPGRGRSMAVARKASDIEHEETKSMTKTPRRGKSLAAKIDAQDDPLALPLCSEVETAKAIDQIVKSPKKAVIELVKVADQVPKTPKRGKSLAPESTKSPVLEEKLPAKTPSKRGKSMAASSTRVASPETAPKTPKIDQMTEDAVEPVSRSGRKIKPKKYFGEFEEEEIVPIIAKIASPIKTIAKKSPVTKKSPPKPVSPVKRHQETDKSEESPKKKLKLEPKDSSDDVKQNKLDPKTSTDEVKKLDEISPNTEERQITKRGVNDHHHHGKDETVPKDESTEQPSDTTDSDPVEQKHVDEEKPKRSRKTLPATSIDIKPASENVVERQEKPKRGRKTLPAPSDDGEGELPKVTKTPVAARRMTTALVPAEETGSSRSGRKIKPKKFFGEAEEEENKTVKSKASVSSGQVNGGGRGKRKTLAAEMDKESDESKMVVDEIEEGPKAEVEECPSREEIMTMVGAVDPVEEMMEELHMDTQDQTKQDANLTQEKLQPDEDLLGESNDNNLHELLDDPKPVGESVPMADDEETTAVQPESVEEIEPVAGESHQGPEPVDEEECTLPEPETLESASEENFRENSVPQTSPAPCPPTEEVLNDPAPLPKEPPLIEVSVPEDPPASLEPEEERQSMVEQDPEPMSTHIVEMPQVMSDVPDQLLSDGDALHETREPIFTEEPAIVPAETSAGSNFSDALLVEDDPVEQTTTATADESKVQNYESVEFLELSDTSATVSKQPSDQVVLRSTDSQEHQHPEERQPNRISTPELEDDLDNTEVPPMDEIDDEKEEQLLEDVPEPTDESFLERDRDNESIIVIPDTPKPPKELIDELELNDKSPVPHTSQVTVARVELPASPVIMKEFVPSTPRTPESKACKTNTCSPDKPEDQEQANVPNCEVIEICDSPIIMMKSELADCKPGSATSTPLRMGSKKSAKDRLMENSRKRSLSVSDAEMVKKNVTFHSPANSTILVDTLDERLKKKNESASKSTQGHRKRSLSEHKDIRNDGVKPAKISKLPNFKNIHQQQFSRMESIEEFHNRKIQRAKEILANSAVKSPAASALIRSDRPPLQKSGSVPPKSPFKGGSGTTSSSSSRSAIVRPQMIPKPTELHKPLSDAERQEKRQKQFQAAFKPKSDASVAGTDKDTPDGTRRVVEQSRHKQNQILKGVRTNKRFELLMKFRDAQE